MMPAKLNIVPIHGGVAVIPTDRPQNPAHALFIVATKHDAEQRIDEMRVRERGTASDSGC